MIIYKNGKRIRKAQNGIKAPVQNYVDVPEGQYFSKHQGVGQDIVGADPGDESRYITQGDNYYNAQRINSNLPGYKGAVTNVTRGEFNDYNTSMKNWQDFSDVDAKGNEIYTNGIDPWADYNKKYGEKTLLRDDKVFRDNATTAFIDDDLSAIDHVKGSFTNPEWGSGSHVANATPYSEYNGISSYYRNRGTVPPAPEVSGVTGITPVGTAPAPGTINVPPAAKVNPTATPVNQGIKKPYKPKKSNYKPEGYNYKKNKSAAGSINKGKRRQKGGLLY